MKTINTLTFLIMLTFFATVSVSYAEIMSVGFSGTEMRAQPKAMDSKVVGKYALYSPLTVIHKGNDYYKVKDYRNRSGWVHRSLLSNASGVVVTGARTNVRSGPSTNQDVVFQLSQGDTALLLNTQDGWVEVKTASGQTGWIADFLVWGE